MSYFLGVDLGTSYFKVAVFDQDGILQGMGRQFVEKHSDNGITCELSVEAFWKTLHRCIGDALSESGRSPEDISALSYSSQTNSFVLLDKDDTPLIPLILWPDSRADEESERLQILVNKKDFLYKTGLGIVPGRLNTIAKIEWIQKNQPQTWNKVSKIMSISDYLIYSLTGRFLSDTSTSAMTGLLNVKESEWWSDALNLFSILPAQLAIPLKVGTLVGNLNRRGAEISGLSIKAQLFTGCLDHYAVAIGAGATCSATISESTGTVLACVNSFTGYSPRKGVNVARGAGSNPYFQMAFDNNGAVALEWYQKNHASHYSIAELIKLAEPVAPGADKLIARPQVHTFPGLEGFINRSSRHEEGHFVRAILESVAFSLSQLVQALEGKEKNGYMVPSGGGAQSRLWLQIKADLLNKPFRVSESVELACKGVSMLCAVGTGYFDTLDEATRQQVKFKEEIHPIPEESALYSRWNNQIINS